MCCFLLLKEICVLLLVSGMEESFLLILQFPCVHNFTLIFWFVWIPFILFSFTGSQFPIWRLPSISIFTALIWGRNWYYFCDSAYFVWFIFVLLSNFPPLECDFLLFGFNVNNVCDFVANALSSFFFFWHEALLTGLKTWVSKTYIQFICMCY